MRKALGTHVLLELFQCEPKKLEDRDYVAKVLVKAAKKAKAKIVDTFFHQFNPTGVSGIVVIEESHFTVHTWPEHGFVAIDFFFCSEKVDIQEAVNVIRQSFEPGYMSFLEVKRGILPLGKPSGAPLGRIPAGVS